MKLEGSPFQNSPVCRGVGYVSKDANVDIAKIELSGRYPEHGWAMNETNYEMAYVLDGRGEFIVEGKETVPLSRGEVVSIATGEKYAWSGTMTLMVVCNPPFDPAQHKLLEEN